MLGKKIKDFLDKPMLSVEEEVEKRQFIEKVKNTNETVYYEIAAGNKINISLNEGETSFNLTLSDEEYNDLITHFHNSNAISIRDWKTIKKHKVGTKVFKKYNSEIIRVCAFYEFDRDFNKTTYDNNSNVDGSIGYVVADLDSDGKTIPVTTRWISKTEFDKNYNLVD